jgi:hypothetical protein
MVITTPMIVYRQGDDVPGERIREILVYEDCISQPDWNVENPDNSDLPETPSVGTAQIELKRASPTGAVRPRHRPLPIPYIAFCIRCLSRGAKRSEKTAPNQDRLSRLLAPGKILRKGRPPGGPRATEEVLNPSENNYK